MFVPLTGGRMVRRLTQLILGLLLFGAGTGLVVQSQLGNPPWDVLHQGLARQFDSGWSTIGNWTILVSFVVLFLWIPLRQRLGLGTVLNAILIGATIDMVARVVDPSTMFVQQVVLLSVGVVTVGIGSGFYIGAQLGPGPRDGLMTGISRLGPPIWATRLVLEATVLVVGWALGGTFGVGTVVFVVTIGPLVHYFLDKLTLSIEPTTSKAVA